MSTHDCLPDHRLAEIAHAIETSWRIYKQTARDLLADGMKLRAEIARLHSLMEQEPHIHQLHFGPGEPFSLVAEHWAVKHLVASFRKTLADAPNFQIVTVEASDSDEAYIVTVRRRHGKLPEVLLLEYREENARLKAELDAARAPQRSGSSDTPDTGATPG
jgi:hypothetical protein